MLTNVSRPRSSDHDRDRSQDLGTALEQLITIGRKVGIAMPVVAGGGIAGAGPRSRGGVWTTTLAPPRDEVPAFATHEDLGDTAALASGFRVHGVP
ncbi:MAG: hypothetical protein ACXWXV_11260, partial [Aeromicrobium sp.]